MSRPRRIEPPTLATAELPSQFQVVNTDVVGAFAVPDASLPSHSRTEDRTRRVPEGA